MYRGCVLFKYHKLGIYLDVLYVLEFCSYFFDYGTVLYCIFRQVPSLRIQIFDLGTETM